MNDIERIIAREQHRIDELSNPDIWVRYTKNMECGELKDFVQSLRDIETIVAALRRTAEDYKAREEGPPCKVGDMLYTNTCVVGDYFRAKDKPYACKVVFIGIGEGDSYVNVAFGNGRMLQFFSGSFGKTVFLTRQEAEAALEVQDG